MHFRKDINIHWKNATCYQTERWTRLQDKYIICMWCFLLKVLLIGGDLRLKFHFQMFSPTRAFFKILFMRESIAENVNCLHIFNTTFGYDDIFQVFLIQNRNWPNNSELSFDLNYWFVPSFNSRLIILLSHRAISSVLFAHS